MSDSSFNDLIHYAADFPAGAILRDLVDIKTGLRLKILRGQLSFCGYVGVHAPHLLDDPAWPGSLPQSAQERLARLGVLPVKPDAQTPRSTHILESLRTLIDVRDVTNALAYLKQASRQCPLRALAVEAPVDLSFMSWGVPGSPLDAGYFWFGWDYAHITNTLDLEAALPDNASPNERAIMADISEQINSGPIPTRPPVTLGDALNEGKQTSKALRDALRADTRFAALLAPVKK